MQYDHIRSALEDQQKTFLQTILPQPHLVCQEPAEIDLSKQL